MPPKGFKTITVQDKIYDYFKEAYEKKKDELAIKDGIKSFSVFVTHRLARMIEQDKKRNP